MTPIIKFENAPNKQRVFETGKKGGGGSFEMGRGERASVGVKIGRKTRVSKPEL